MMHFLNIVFNLKSCVTVFVYAVFGGGERNGINSKGRRDLRTDSVIQIT